MIKIYLEGLHSPKGIEMRGVIYYGAEGTDLPRLPFAPPLTKFAPQLKFNFSSKILSKLR